MSSGAVHEAIERLEWQDAAGADPRHALARGHPAHRADRRRRRPRGLRERAPSAATTTSGASGAGRTPATASFGEQKKMRSSSSTT